MDGSTTPVQLRLTRRTPACWRVTFDNPPLGQLRDKYAFTPTSGWLDHLRLSSVRFDDGGSGSFVSPRGLVLTNHHVALGQLQKVSSPQKDYVADGFYAASAAEELRCPDLELNVLVSMMSLPASRYASWMVEITSGRVSTRTSLSPLRSCG